MDRDCLVLFSGGRDSFISACMCVERNYIVNLITFNNGSIAGEGNILTSVKRLQEVYGEDKVKYCGVSFIWGTIGEYRSDVFDLHMKEISNKYPNLKISQLNCLHCQTAMWVHAIAYCVSNKIPRLCVGYRYTDEFCTGDSLWNGKVEGLAHDHGIDVVTPLWDKQKWKEQPWLRNYELAQRGFSPKVLEPKCFIGVTSSKLTKEESEDLNCYFDGYMAESLSTKISELIRIYKTTFLKERSVV